MRQVSRASVAYILWVRGFRDHTISGPGYNLFKPLRRHFRAGAGPDAGAGAPAARFFPRFLSFQCFARRKISPRSSAANSPIADEARRRRFASRGKRLSDGTCGNARPWRFPGGTKGIRTTYHDFASQKGKIRKSRRQPSRQNGYYREGVEYPVLCSKHIELPPQYRKFPAFCSVS
jgi:hypothetical protein